MMPAIYSAISGLEAHQTMLNVTANNLANVDTIGYKAERTTFESELSELISGGSGQTASNGGTNPEQVGLGVRVGSIDQIMSAGSMQNTGNALDVAIQGDGFLAVGSSSTTVAAPTASTATTTGYTPGLASSTAGAVPINNTSSAPGVTTAALPTNITYTRAGNLTTDAQGYLTTASGQYVLGFATPQQSSVSGMTAANSATYIYIPPGSTNVSIGPSGEVTYTDSNPNDSTYGNTCTAGYLAVASFPNEAGLTRDAGTSWTQSANSGPASYGTPDSGAFASTQTISGELEQSNVDMATEFTNMIQAEDGYQANSSVIQTSDQMMQTLIQMVQA
ncbi:MAG: flagellar hook-basal body protein [Solirubrobacteraceae bacterium]